MKLLFAAGAMRRFLTLLLGILIGCAFCSTLLIANAATSRATFEYSTGTGRSSAATCVTSATVGLAKAGFDGVNTLPDKHDTGIYGHQGSYTGLVVCIPTPPTSIYLQMAIGPPGAGLDAMYKTIDKSFR